MLTLFVLGQTGCKAEPWSQWDKYSQRFLDDSGRVIDRTAQDRTTSEGESYAMFFALVANDRPRFDKLLNWSEANLAGGDLTPSPSAWNWGKAQDGSWKILDDNPAADADLWMAYSLMEAGRLWSNPRYAKLGSTMALRIAQQETVDYSGTRRQSHSWAKRLSPQPHDLGSEPQLPAPALAVLLREGPAAGSVESDH